MIFHFMGRKSCREEEQVHGGANRLCPQASRAGQHGRRGLQEDGHQRGHLLPVEEEVPKLGSSELRRLRMLEEESRKLKAIRATQMHYGYRRVYAM
jgi:hypothetical protein